MSYVKQVWADGEGGGTPLSSTRMNYIETGLESASANAEGPWVAYTPTYTNFTLGDGSATARYKAIGKTVHASGYILLGSTSVVGTLPRISLPLAASTANLIVPELIYTDAGSSFYFGTGRVVQSAVELYTLSVAATYPTLAAVTSAVPFTWVANDEIRFSVTYQAA